jgi:hypothetical protein
MHRKSSPELKISSPNLQKIFSKETFTENNINKFIQDLENKETFNNAFKKLLIESESKSTKLIINSEMELLENEF